MTTRLRALLSDGEWVYKSCHEIIPQTGADNFLPISSGFIYVILHKPQANQESNPMK